MNEGDWVVAGNGSIGPGQIVRLDQHSAAVRVGATPGIRDSIDLPRSQLRLFVPTAGHILWIPVRTEDKTAWIQGTFLRPSEDKWVVTPSPGAEYAIPPSIVWMKPYNVQPLAIEMLGEVMPGAKGEMAPRRRFRTWLTEQQACTAGYSTLISTPVRPVPHQLSAVSRVLGDPVRRFLLADEVGLGKTIEAGLVIQQILHDDLTAIASVVVPESLVDQWIDELRDTVRLGALMRRCRVVPFAQISQCAGSTLLVIDEAHRPSDDTHADHEHYPTMVKVAHEVRDLLLLSATPLRGHASTLLRMMHLIDPGAYPLDDPDQFSVRLNARASQANLLNLLGFETSAELVNELLDELTALLPSNHGLEELIDGIRQAESDEPRANLVNDLVVEVQERFRIGRRLIRASQAGIRRENYPIPGRALQVASVPGLGGELVDEFMRRWIGLAHDHPETAKGIVPEVLTAGLGGALTLLAWVADRQARLRDGATFAFPSEAELLKEYTLRPLDTSSYIDAILHHFDSMFAKEGPPIVVAVTRTDVATHLLERLRAEKGPNRVKGYTASMTSDERRLSLHAVNGADPPRVVVIDHSAEEGCNLQRARSIINIDLPWDVNRLEQRLGRLDRYSPGAATPARVIVLTDPDCQLQGKNLTFLDTVGVFEQSVAGVQRSLSAVLDEMAGAILEKGVDALTDRQEAIRSQIADDRRDSGLLEYLESATAFGELPSDFVDRLMTLDEEWGKGQKAINGLTDRDGGYNLRRREFVVGGQVFNYQVSEYTSVDGPQRDRLTRAVGNPVTTSRPLALERPHVGLLRIGHDFVDALSRCVDLDERGRVEIRWWHDPAAVQEMTRFDVEVRIEWRIDPAVGPAELVRAAQHRLSMVLPKRIVNLLIDAAGNVIDPADDWFANGTGERLEGTRAAKAAYQIGRWRDMVDDVEDGVKAEIRRRMEPDIDHALIALNSESDRRLRVLAASEPASTAGEKQIAEWLLTAARLPRVVIESVHAHIKSSVKV